MIYAMLVILVLAVAVLWLFRQKPGRISAADKQLIFSAWQQVRELQNGDGHALSKAVIEADKILDNCMQMVGIPGATMGERLKNAKGYIRNLNDVWNAHKLRNQLVHEISAQPHSREVHAAVKAFELAIRGLGLL